MLGEISYIQKELIRLCFDADMLNSFVKTYLEEGAIEVSKEDLIRWITRWDKEYSLLIQEMNNV